jgi:hypothetical protein
MKRCINKLKSDSFRSLSKRLPRSAALLWHHDRCLSSTVAVASWVLACGTSAQSPPNVAANPHWTAPTQSAAGLRPCPDFCSAVGGLAGSAGDVDGDGVADSIGAICDSGPGARCAMQLCLGSGLGPPRLAASWLSPQLEWVQPLVGVAPRMFDAYPAIAAAECFVPRRFRWAQDGNGYVTYPAEHCVCNGRPSAVERCGGTQ